MTWKALFAAGLTALEAGSFVAVDSANGQASAARGAGHAASVAQPPAEPQAPRGDTFTPPAPRGNLRGDIAANSKDERRDANPPPESRSKPLQH